MNKIIGVVASLIFAGGCFWFGFRNFLPLRHKLMEKRTILETSRQANDAKNDQIDELRRRTEMFKEDREYVRLTSMRKGKADEHGFVCEFKGTDPNKPVK